MIDNRLSIILLSYNSEQNINNIYNGVIERLDKEGIKFELIIIDDASKDNSYEKSLQLEQVDRVRSYQLSKNFTSHYSVFAGFSVSKGACAVAIPDDFQISMDTLVEMYRHWENGYKIVVPYRDVEKTHLQAELFPAYIIKLWNRFSEITFPKGGADTFLADREIIDIFNSDIHPKNTSTIVEALRLGFDPLFIPMKRHKGVNKKSRWTIKKKFRLATDTFLSSSSFPIKFISSIGIGSFLFLAIF